MIDIPTETMSKDDFNMVSVYFLYDGDRIFEI